MSLLSAVTKAFTDPGALVQDALVSVLPKEIGDVVGNVAAGAVDLYAGKELQALQHGLAALADLPQLTKSAGSALSKLTAGSPGFEPSPPGGRAGQMVASGSWRNPATLQNSLQKLTQSLSGHGGNITVNININGTPGQGTATATAVPATPSGAATQASSSGPTVGASTSATSASATTASAASPTTSASGTTNASGASGSSNVAATPGKDGKYDMAALGAMDNTDFMNAIRDGKISDKVANDPAAMRAIQARMDGISQMNQLMTSMMQAMHQMEMSIIQNIRV
jgi:hypothetical protein